MTGPYDDIIHLPHPVSVSRPQMPIANRAAQFSPFAALTGHEAAVKEAARLTDDRRLLDESSLADLDRKLQALSERIGGHPEISVTYFRRDEKKEDGSSVTVTGEIKKLDRYERVIVMSNGKRIKIEDILNIES